MYPILWSWGNVVLPSWHAFFVFAAFAAYILLSKLVKMYAIELKPHINLIFCTAYMGGYFGARLCSLLIEEQSWSLLTISSLFEHGSMTFYGGFIGALLCTSFYILLNKISWLLVWDLGIPSGFLGLSIGRIGCFLNGDDYGIEILTQPQPWWSVIFSNHPDRIPRFPVQLLESGLVLFLVVSLVLLLKKNKSTQFSVGTVGSLGVAAYCVLRFFDEFLRGDERGWFMEAVFAQTFSTSQGLSLLCFFVLALVYGLSKFGRNRKRHDFAS